VADVARPTGEEEELLREDFTALLTPIAQFQKPSLH
jgi:hypothetical protein